MIFKKVGNKNLAILFAAMVLYTATLAVHYRFERPTLTLTKQESTLNFNQDLLRIFSVGNKKLLADLIWVQTLLQSDMEHYTKTDLGNWMYYRFMAISALDEKFYENYFYGGMYLSIVKDDPYSASFLYRKGLDQYPDDYNLNYNAGFNYFYELNDAKNGLFYLDKIKDHPRASKLMISVVAKLRAQLGEDLGIILRLIEERYDLAKDEVLRQKLKKEIYSIKAEMDLKCLNEGKTNCGRYDDEGRPYVRNSDGVFMTQKPFAPYRVKRRAGMKDHRE